MKKIICAFLLTWMGVMCLYAQGLDANVEQRLKDFFTHYETRYANIGKCRLERYEVNHDRRTLRVFANPNFGYQPFTPENTEAIYRLLKQSLPGPVNYYDLTVYADGKPIEELIPNYLRKKKDKDRQWKRTNDKGAPWTRNVSRPYTAGKGLEGRHIALWQSHGKHYKNDKQQWEWQRPRLFCTTEDLFTQSFVIPYLIPMLEHAGAVVYTPRERDWQRNEVIVDNDTPKGIYQETKSRKGKWKTAPGTGFAQRRITYQDGQNPFAEGTARFAATEKKPEKAFAQWIPQIPETGSYAVYVSYKTLPQSVSDAKYLVFHKGGVTEFLVNQQIGGGTWVYLGTFEFDKGSNEYGMVVLSNESKQKGVVCADAVRFGGGMGNIARNGSISGVPRYLEGARYGAQWAGFPYEVYSPSQGKNDYTDDINARSLAVNYLSGGSVYHPHEKGLGVPIEMTLGLHSDAGFSKEDQLIGSLGIYTTDFNEGKLAAGISRYASRDLADRVLTGLQRDLSAQLGTPWQRRSMWNRNYSESRLPAVPSMILELLSHQNFADLKQGHDPRFKFAVGRSVYKSILKFLADMHGTDYVVQPLPVKNFAIRMDPDREASVFRLSWQAVDDPLEPTAKAQQYIVYTRIGHGGFDNGTLVQDNHYTFKAEPGLVYSFKVTAVNRGGESFPSEILAAYRAPKSQGTVLIVNGFDRLSAPGTVETNFLQGFDLQTDPGVAYLHTPAFCGKQQNFNRSHIGRETADGLGYSGSELEGMLIAGNTFDYPFVHGKAIQAAGRYSFVSCGKDAVENGFIRLTDYSIVDVILGVQRQPFANGLQQHLTTYCRQGGRLMVSGAYIGSDATDATTLSFTSQVLKYTSAGLMDSYTPGTLYGANTRFSIPRTVNTQSYAVPSSDCLSPISPAYTAFVYTPDNYSAGVAYAGTYRTFALGFPFESIQGVQERARIMSAILGFLGSK